MSRIRRLDPSVVNKIAAGEVVERPASVVKELLENSIDALATRIEVDIVQGGSELIRVVDDGEGLHQDDLCLAVTSHATSKIGTAEDLFSVQTMGFRGEALASIASVSRFHIRSRPDQQVEGYELQVDGGQVGELRPCGCPRGTRVEVQQLFASTPVRRKFLKTVGTEFGHISEQFIRIALAHPRVHMVLRHNRKTVYELPATDQIRDRLRMFHGSELAENLIWVESEAEVSANAAGQTDVIRIWGYVAHPSHSKSTRKSQYLFLNGRWIQDRSLQHALQEAYRGLLMTGRYPVVFLFLEMPSGLVDVNVHPSKWEVRFQDSQQLYRQLLSTVRNKFLSLELDSRLQADGDPAAAVAAPATGQQLRLSAPSPSWSSSSSVAPTGTPVTSADFPRAWSAPESLDQRAGRDNMTTTSAVDHSPMGPGGIAQAEGAFPAGDADSERALQIQDCYLVTATEEGMMVIDQHALHERILYEHLRPRVLQGAVESQQLLVPDAIECTVKEAALIEEHRALFAQLGFGIESFGGQTVLLTCYPAMLHKVDLPQMVRDLCEHLETTRQDPSRRDILDELLHMMSCKGAIKSGQRLSPEEIQSLLEQRHLIDDAHHCPHGRPTALVLTRSDLDRQFGRLG